MKAQDKEPILEERYNKLKVANKKLKEAAKKHDEELLTLTGELEKAKEAAS